MGTTKITSAVLLLLLASAARAEPSLPSDAAAPARVRRSRISPHSAATRARDSAADVLPDLAAGEEDLVRYDRGMIEALRYHGAWSTDIEPLMREALDPARPPRAFASGVWALYVDDFLMCLQFHFERCDEASFTLAEVRAAVLSQRAPVATISWQSAPWLFSRAKMLMHCTAAGRCRTLLNVAPERPHAYDVSRDGRHALAWFGEYVPTNPEVRIRGWLAPAEAMLIDYETGDEVAMPRMPRTFARVEKVKWAHGEVIITWSSSDGIVESTRRAVPEDAPERTRPGEYVDWDPPLEDRSVDTSLVQCPARGGCRRLMRADSYDVQTFSVSPSGRHVVVWLASRDADFGARFRVFDLRTRRVAEFVIPELRASPSHEVVWTAGENILLGWSAGTSVSENVLYTARGRKIASFSGGGVEASPDGEIIIQYRSASDPGRDASLFRFAVSSLRDGRLRASLPLPEGSAYVRSITWSRGSATISTADAADRPLADTRFTYAIR